LDAEITEIARRYIFMIVLTGLVYWLRWGRYKNGAQRFAMPPTVPDCIYDWLAFMLLCIGWGLAIWNTSGYLSGDLNLVRQMLVLIMLVCTGYWSWNYWDLIQTMRETKVPAGDIEELEFVEVEVEEVP